MGLKILYELQGGSFEVRWLTTPLINQIQGALETKARHRTWLADSMQYKPTHKSMVSVAVPCRCSPCQRTLSPKRIAQLKYSWLSRRILAARASLTISTRAIVWKPRKLAAAGVNNSGVASWKSTQHQHRKSGRQGGGPLMRQSVKDQATDIKIRIRFRDFEAIAGGRPSAVADCPQ